MEPPHTAYLDIRLSTEPGTLWRRFPLIGTETPIGRPEEGEPGVNLYYANISRKHACVVCEASDAGTTYFLENRRGQAGIRLYEKMLLPGERHALRHGYMFHIPGMPASAVEPYFSITFCLDGATARLSIELSQPPYISIFGRLIRFTPQEYTLLEYLYTHKNEICLYHDIIAHIWAPQPRTSERIQASLEKLYADPDDYSYKKEALDILVAKVRRKIRDASGGISFIETIHGRGLCLRA